LHDDPTLRTTALITSIEFTRNWPLAHGLPDAFHKTVTTIDDLFLAANKLKADTLSLFDPATFFPDEPRLALNSNHPAPSI
jgi:hypothetical protein